MVDEVNSQNGGMYVFRVDPPFFDRKPLINVVVFASVDTDTDCT